MAKSHELLKDRRRLRRKKHLNYLTVVSMVLLVILIGGGWYLWNSPFFQLKKITIVGNNNFLSAELSSRMEEILAGKYWWFFSKQVNWFYPEQDIVRNLRLEFPELARIELNNFNFGVLKVKIALRQPAAIWCELDDCYFMDDSGLLYSKAPQFSNFPLLTLTGAPLPIAIGSRPLGISEFKELLITRSEINRTLQAEPILAGFSADQVSVVESFDYFFTLGNRRLFAGEWNLFVSRIDSPVLVSSRLIAALATPTFLADYRLATGRLEYIDVRFDRKVFYRFLTKP